MLVMDYSESSFSVKVSDFSKAMRFQSEFITFRPTKLLLLLAIGDELLQSMSTTDEPKRKV